MKYKLRDWRLSDLASLVEHANNYQVAKWLTDQFPYPYAEADGLSFIESVLQDKSSLILAITVDGKAVGSIGIFPQSGVHRKSAEIGYWLSEAYWGQGITPRAIREMVNLGFKKYDIVRIFARTFAGNAQSQRALEKAGFTLEARLRNAIFKNKALQDELIYVLLK